MNRKSIYKIAAEFENKLRKLAQPCHCRICDSGGNCAEKPEPCQCKCGCEELTSLLICSLCQRGRHAPVEKYEDVDGKVYYSEPELEDEPEYY